MVVPLVGIELPLESNVGRIQGYAVTQVEGAVGVVVGHVEHFVPAFGIDGLLGFFGIFAATGVVTALYAGANAINLRAIEGHPCGSGHIAVVLGVTITVVAAGEVQIHAGILGSTVGNSLFLGAVKVPAEFQAIGIGGNLAEGLGDLGGAQSAAPYTGVGGVTVESLLEGPGRAVVPRHGQVETTQRPGSGGVGSGNRLDERLIVIDRDVGAVTYDGEDHPFTGRPCIGLAVLGYLLLANAHETGVEAQLTVGAAVVGEAEEERLALIGIGEFAQAVAEELVAGLVLILELVVVPLVGIELPLESNIGRIQRYAFTQHKGAVGLVVGHVEHLVPTGGVVVLVFNLGSLLGNHDGLHLVLGAGLIDEHFTLADFAGGVVFQFEGDGVVGSLHVGHGNPVYLRFDGFLIQGNVGNDVSVYSTVLGLADVVDVVLGIGLGVGGLGISLLFLGTEGELHDGSQTHLGVGVSQGSTLGHGLGSDHELVGLDRSLEVGIGEDVHLGVRGLGVHGVVHIEGIGGSDSVGGLGDHQTEGRSDGDVDLAVVGEGEHHILVGHFDVGEDTVLQGSAAAEAAQLFLFAGDNGIQLSVLHIDVGHLAHGQFLAVIGESGAVDGPVKDIAFLDNAQDTGATAAGNLEGNYSTVAVSNGDAFGGLFHLLDILAKGNGLESLDLGFQIAELGLERSDSVAKFGVIILFGAAHQEQSHCKSV